MATANATITVTKVINESNTVRAFGTIAIEAAAAEYLAGGLALNWLPVANRQPPLSVQVKGISGYDFEYDADAAKLIIRQQNEVAASPMIELPDAAIPAALSDDTINFEAVFNR